MLMGVLCCVPYVLIYLKNLWQQAHYQFYPLLIAAVAYLAWKRWSGKRYEFQPTLGDRIFKAIAIVAFTGGCFGALCATVFASPWMGYFGFFMCLTAWFAYQRDAENGQSLVYLGLPVALIWQPPYNTIVTADTILIQQLQLISARLSSKALDTLGYIHFQPGTVLEIAGKSFGVAEACSGIQSFFAVVCVAALLVAFFRRNILHAGILLATSPIWAVVLNTLRITLIPIAYQSFGVDLSHGFLHDLLGYSTMTLAVLLLLSTDELILALFGWHEQATTEGAKQVAANSHREVSELKRSPSLIVAGLFFIACFAIQSYDTAQSWSIQRDTIDFFRDDSLVEMSKSDLGDKLGDWPLVFYDRQERGRGNDDLGERSDLWYYQAPYGRVSASLDQRFPGWHELTRCYRSAGWRMLDRRVHIGPAADNWPIVEVQLQRNEEFGHLFFSLSTRGGLPVKPPGAYTYWTILQERLLGRLTPAVRGTLFGTATYQTQLFASTSRPLREEEAELLLTRYRDVRNSLWQAAYSRL